MQFKALVHSKNSVQFEESFSYLFDDTSYCLELESVRVGQKKMKKVLEEVKMEAVKLEEKKRW